MGIALALPIYGLKRAPIGAREAERSPLDARPSGLAPP